MSRKCVIGVCATLTLVAAAMIGCAQKHASSQGSVVVGGDTLSAAQVDSLVLDTVLAPPQRRMRAARQTALAALAKSQPRDTQQTALASDLSEQLSRRTGGEWTPEAASSLLEATRMLYTAAKTRPSPGQLARFVDSLTSSSASYPGGDASNWFPTDTTGLSTKIDPTDKDDMCDILARLLALRQDVCVILYDYVSVESRYMQGSKDIADLVKGLVGGEKRAAPSAAIQPEVKKIDNSAEALLFRSQKSIQDSINVHLPNIKALYKKALKADESMKGVVWVNFRVASSGSVLTATIKQSDIRNKDFLNELCAYTMAMRFLPIPDKIGAMSFVFPFEFTPE